jgi:hypothetical protein
MGCAGCFPLAADDFPFGVPVFGFGAMACIASEAMRFWSRRTPRSRRRMERRGLAADVHHRGGAEPGSADRSRQVAGNGLVTIGVSPQVMRLLIKTVRGSGYVFAAAAVGITLPSTNVRSPGSYDE